MPVGASPPCRVGRIARRAPQVRPRSSPCPPCLTRSSGEGACAGSLARPKPIRLALTWTHQWPTRWHTTTRHQGGRATLSAATRSFASASPIPRRNCDWFRPLITGQTSGLRCSIGGRSRSFEQLSCSLHGCLLSMQACYCPRTAEDVTHVCDRGVTWGGVRLGAGQSSPCTVASSLPWGNRVARSPGEICKGLY